MTALTPPRVCAVVVSYHPDLTQIKQLLTACLPQVGELVVVDNGSADGELAVLRAWSRDMSFGLLELGDNLGVGTAQNRGVAWARERKCNHILFFDQDSVPSQNMVDKLLAAQAALDASGVPLAAVGPRLVDRRTSGCIPFVRLGVIGVRKIGCGHDAWLRTDFLISSGMLVSLSVLDQVGLLDETLFIDLVDTEWCFRARGKGLALYGVCSAELEHGLGENVIRVGGLWIFRHSPVRQYYMMRNSILVYRRAYSPRVWIARDIFKLAFKFAMFSLVFAPRFDNIRMMWQGLKDGISGRSGRFPLNSGGR